jgi:hypothetical protein
MMNDDQKEARTEFARAEGAYNEARARKEEIMRTRQDALRRLDAHYHELLTIHVERIPAWSSVKAQLSGVIDACDSILPHANARLEQTELRYRQAKLRARQLGVA